MPTINQLKSIIYIGKCLGVEFCTWNSELKPNNGLIPKIIICVEVLIVTGLVYVVLPKTTAILLNVTQIAFWVKMLAVEYALLNYYLGTYLMQNTQLQVYAAIHDTDLTLGKFAIVALENTAIKRLFWFAFSYAVLLICYVLYCYDNCGLELPVITYLIPSVLSIHKAVTNTCTVLILKDQFSTINRLVENFKSGGKCLICTEYRQIFDIDGHQHQLHGLCEQHTIRSSRLMYEKITDTCTVLNTAWSYVQSANLTWAFTELLYQCLVWYEILNKHLTINWNSAVLSFFAIFTAMFTTFVFVEGCDDTTAEAVKTRKILHKFYLNSKCKSAIKEDVKSFSLQMLHRESPFSDSGMPADTSNTLVSELSALVTILVFGIQYNLPRSEGVRDL